jgi:hypothetical protein
MKDRINLGEGAMIDMFLFVDERVSGFFNQVCLSPITIECEYEYE